MWIFLGLAALVAVLTGWLPSATAREIAFDRGAPVLGFLVAVTILAELSDKAGVFDAAAARCARLARGSTFVLYLLVAALGTALTIGMSLDTTAVLLTPVVLSLTQKLGLKPLPFAILVVWLANTASLLLPVSNLTNLLALQRENLSTLEFAKHMALPELVAVVVTVSFLAILFRNDIRGRYELPEPTAANDRVLFAICSGACVLLAPGVIAGIEPWLVTAPLAAVVVVAFAIRQRKALSMKILPWRVVIFTLGLFLVVADLSRHGLTSILENFSGTSPTQTALTAAVTSNLANNLPTYLAIEHAVPSGNTEQLLAALLGTNIGPMILVWGSLATILWRERCKARGVEISALRFAAIGALGVPLVLGSSLATLILT